jgi:hypothetical protein
VCEAPRRRQRNQQPASCYCCYLMSLATPHFECLAPPNATTFLKTVSGRRPDSDYRQGRVPATDDSRYGSVTREFNLEIYIHPLYVVCNEMHLSRHGARCH